VSLISAVGGAGLFLTGVSFNHLVTLFHRNPIRQKNLAEALVGHTPQRSFGWIGFGSLLTGTALGLVSLVLGLQGWEITRFWLWQLGSALFLLVGGQILLFWLDPIMGHLAEGGPHIWRRTAGESAWADI
jgi:hypothetical protein